MKTITSRSIRSILLISALLVDLLGQEQPSDSPRQADSLAAQDIVGPFITEALHNNPGLVAHDKRYLAALKSIEFAGALPNPSIQLTHFVESVQTRTGPQEQALMLQQPIPWLGKLNRKREVARAQSTALWHAYTTQQFKLVDQVATHVLDIAFLHKSIAITKANIAILKRLESIVEDRVKSGGDLADLLRLQVEIERFDDSAARQEAQRISTTALLESLLGTAPTDRIFNIDWNAPAKTVSAPSQWLSAIKERSPQIAMLRSIEASQEARERLAKLANRPDFTLGINYINTSEAINPATPGSGTDPWALMLGVSLPVWGKANNAIALQAVLEKEAFTAQIDELELQLLGEGRSWIAKLKDAEGRILRYDTKLIPLARQAQEITESSYRSGTTSILDLIDSERALLKLETEYWRAAADAWLARWKLAILSGGLWLN